MNRSPYSDGQNLFCLLAALLSTLSVQGLFFILPDSGTPGMGGMYQLNASAMPTAKIGLAGAA